MAYNFKDRPIPSLRDSPSLIHLLDKGFKASLHLCLKKSLNLLVPLQPQAEKFHLWDFARTPYSWVK